MTTKRVIALVIGCVMILPAIGMLFGGGALAIAYATQRDDDGYFDATIDQLQTPTAAITGEDLRFATDPGSPDWLIDTIDLDVRIRATALDSDSRLRRDRSSGRPRQISGRCRARPGDPHRQRRTRLPPPG
jgi:hypothetical protein